MIKLHVANDKRQEFSVHADEPVTVEVGLYAGKIIAFVYMGTEVDEHSEPIGAYDATNDENKDWEQ